MFSVSLINDSNLKKIKNFQKLIISQFPECLLITKVHPSTIETKKRIKEPRFLSSMKN